MTPAGPTRPAVPMRRHPRDAPCARERPSLTAERGLCGDATDRAISGWRCRPRDRTPRRTGARAPQRGSTPQTPKAQTEWFGLCVVGHSGLEPEANGLRSSSRVGLEGARDGGGSAWLRSLRERGYRGGHRGDERDGSSEPTGPSLPICRRRPDGHEVDALMRHSEQPLTQPGP